MVYIKIKRNKCRQPYNKDSDSSRPKHARATQYYNNGVNEFQKPTFTPPAYKAFETTIPQTINLDSAGKPTDNPEDAVTTVHNPAYDAALQAYNDAYQKNQSDEKDAFNALNTCPGGLVSTTPGSVVANQITTSLGSNF